MATQPTVVVIGAGPGGVAAARRLRDSAGLRVVLVTRGGVSTYAPGILPVLQQMGTLDQYTGPVQLTGVETYAGEVIALGEQRVALADGRELYADALIAAPGLVTDVSVLPAGAHTYPIWELTHAARASEAIQALERGRLVIAIASLPYRCPPAPYGLALALRAYYQAQARAVEVTLVTPEPRPLDALGERASTYLRELLADGHVELRTSASIDVGASRDGMLALTGGEPLPYDLGLIVPPHARPDWLAPYAGASALVPVDGRLRVQGAQQMWAVGDVAATPLPRAAGVAEAQGRAAAEDALVTLGLLDPASATPAVPTPSCYVWQGGERAGRILVAFPDGMPPAGKPEVSVEAPSATLYAEALAGRDRWLATLRD